MITILVPAFNEEACIDQFIEDFVQKISLQEEFELLIINDGSTDTTQSIIGQRAKQHSYIRLVNHSQNQGLGAALKTGIAEAHGDIIVTMDADLTHPVSLIPELVSGLANADICIASRYVKGGGMENVPSWRIAISRVANLVFNVLFLTSIGDLSSGFKAYKTEKLRTLDLKSTGFSCQLEIMIHFIKYHYRHKEIPFVLINRKMGNSKFDTLKEGKKYLKILFKLLHYRWQKK